MPSAAEAPPLRLTDLTVRFGGVTAVDGVSLELPKGCVLGLIGPNGAGKSTILDAISGFAPCTGTIEVHGQDVSLAPAAERGRLGLGRSFQDGRLFPSLTVRETLTVALERHSDRVGPFNACIGFGPSRRLERHLAAAVEDLIGLHGLDAYRDKFISELSTGTRRIVDLACVVAHHPSVLLLDEPSSGIAQREAEALAPMLVRIREQLDCSIIIVEHDIPLIRAVSDELVALETGRVIARGTAEEVLHDPDVVELYLGTKEAAIYRSGAVPVGAVAAKKRKTKVR